MIKNTKVGKTNIKPLKEGEILVFLFFILIMFLLIIMLVFSKIKICIDDYRYISTLPKLKKTEYKITVCLYVLKIIPVFKIKINKNKFKKIREKLKEKFKNIDLLDIEKEKEINKKILKATKALNINIDKFYLKVELGTENVIFSSIIIPIVGTLVAWFLQRENVSYNKQTFDIKPIYYNQNLLNILFSGIFEIKMIHIINIIYILTKKEGVKKYERTTTSNRRTYGYSHE